MVHGHMLSLKRIWNWYTESHAFLQCVFQNLVIVAACIATSIFPLAVHSTPAALPTTNHAPILHTGHYCTIYNSWNKAFSPKCL